ncbi:hypothetical protein [Geobacter sp. SVR]|uniref:hypothetical protein n=1 Tax=Geobacter sp. SVR TaxID=2495594 RepID=UPI00143F021A|nr:hypothetical protein [Geobacter sp. SVR]BCS55481.1 hypothetical protein GSVR_37890 [Geobacter sp. SVR]GCF83484.1 hypothetical protein GSbR_00840 [Geobacter sp. SVR]
MADLIDVPRGMKVIKSVVVKRLQSGFFAEVFLVLNNGQYEAALFLNDKFKPGPPIPHELDTPSEQHSHWMGVRPSIGLTPEEAERIISEVESENAIHRKKMSDRWGKQDY